MTRPWFEPTTSHPGRPLERSTYITETLKVFRATRERAHVGKSRNRATRETSHVGKSRNRATRERAHFGKSRNRATRETAH
ncbi:hypothetical protein CHS0354_015852, partial [Potamilus streckersoni]